MDESSCEEITNYVLTDMSKNNEEYAIRNAELESQKNKLSDNHYKTHVIDDFYFYITTSLSYKDYWKVIYEIVNDGLGKYLSKWGGVVTKQKDLYNPLMKYHIVSQHGGYHSWHKEWIGCRYPQKDMVLVWHFSLTSHKNEGELEFKYYDHRIEPKAGRLLIWPTGFTHMHRGNPIRSDSQKHYLTGWWYLHPSTAISP